MKHTRLIAALSLAWIAACSGAEEEAAQVPSSNPMPESTPAPEPEPEDGNGHAHAEDPLGTVMIGDLSVELAQGHGAVVAGAEGHLVVKLPYSDGGSTIVRAWIGTEDRTASYVGKGQYAPAHDDYDIHATAPSPLPANTMWWIEIEAPSGAKILGSAKPILE